ncbi:exported protein of unknown function [Modestobacter italicus]|uniref:Uncharacterized protein n=1 Tax=Modestobacter italicus (strain DSM 44449 / CECT 9708 / BC 501) TaxID=2732864 RepID=I4ES29_MODI5|nr:exported protein of unknown function [Modestobacter marinus]
MRCVPRSCSPCSSVLGAGSAAGAGPTQPRPREHPRRHPREGAHTPAALQARPGGHTLAFGGPSA